MVLVHTGLPCAPGLAPEQLQLQNQRRHIPHPFAGRSHSAPIAGSCVPPIRGPGESREIRQ